MILNSVVNQMLLLDEKFTLVVILIALIQSDLHLVGFGFGLPFDGFPLGFPKDPPLTDAMSSVIKYY